MKLVSLMFSCVLLAQDPSQQQPRNLTLEQAVTIAHSNNPRLSLERINALIGDQITTEIRAGLLPTITGNATVAGALTDSRISASGGLNNPLILNRMAAGVTFSQLLTDFGRTSNLVEGSRLRSQSQRQTVEAIQALLTLAVHRAYYSVLRATNVLRVSEQTIEARTLALDEVSNLSKAGLRSSLDVGFAEVNLSEAKLALLSASNDRSAFLADLSTTLGYNRPQNLAVQDVPAITAKPPSAEELIAEAFQKRPDAIALRFERDAAVKVALAERKLNMPVLSALATAGAAPLHDDRLKNHYAAAGINLSIPVFNGGFNTARRQEAELRVQGIDQRLRDLENQIAREITTAVLAAQTAFERVDLTAKLLAQAKITASLARERYNLGLSSIVELSQAELNETAAEIRATSAKYDYLMQTSVVDYQAGRLH